MAEHHLYNLIRKFASATKALAVYDCQKCLSELEQLPHAHQKSPWVLAMVGRAHYEKLDYTAVRLRLTLLLVMMLKLHLGRESIQGRSQV
jgi:hypothetical protein